MSEVKVYEKEKKLGPNTFTPLRYDRNLIDTEFTQAPIFLQNLNNIMDEKFDLLYTQIDQLKNEISDLKSQIGEEETKIVYIKEISREDAKAEIIKFFDENMGDFYPSEISETLGIEYELVWDLIKEIEEEGRIEPGDK